MISVIRGDDFVRGISIVIDKFTIDDARRAEAGEKSGIPVSLRGSSGLVALNAIGMQIERDSNAIGMQCSFFQVRSNSIE